MSKALNQLIYAYRQLPPAAQNALWHRLGATRSVASSTIGRNPKRQRTMTTTSHQSSPYNTKTTVYRFPNYKFMGRRNRIHRMHPERKFYDGEVAMLTIASGGTTVLASPFVNIIGGNGQQERIGRKIYVTSLHLRGCLVLPNAAEASSQSDRVRIIIFFYSANNQATNAQPLEVYLETPKIDSMRNLRKTKIIKKLYDHTFVMNSHAGAGTDTAPTRKNIQIDLLPKFVVEYADQTSKTPIVLTEANIQVMAISEQGRIQFGFNYRVRYLDN